MIDRPHVAYFDACCSVDMQLYRAAKRAGIRETKILTLRELADLL